MVDSQIPVRITCPLNNHIALVSRQMHTYAAICIIFRNCRTLFKELIKWKTFSLQMSTLFCMYRDGLTMNMQSKDYQPHLPFQKVRFREMSRLVPEPCSQSTETQDSGQSSSFHCSSHLPPTALLESCHCKKDSQRHPDVFALHNTIILDFRGGTFQNMEIVIFATTHFCQSLEGGHYH